MCRCDHTRGQDCDWCNGINAELGITPPTSEPYDLAPAGSVPPDPWLDPTQPLLPPF